MFYAIFAYYCSLLLFAIVGLILLAWWVHDLIAQYRPKRSPYAALLWRAEGKAARENRRVG